MTSSEDRESVPEDSRDEWEVETSAVINIQRRQVRRSLTVHVLAVQVDAEMTATAHSLQIPGGSSTELVTNADLVRDLWSPALSNKFGIETPVRWTPDDYQVTSAETSLLQGAGLEMGLLRKLVDPLTDGMSNAEESKVYRSVAYFPIPTFGSPPSGFQTLQDLAGKTGFMAVLGTAAWSDHPVMALIAGSTAGLVWFTKPAARVVRRSLAEKLALRMGTTVKDVDELE